MNTLIKNKIDKINDIKVQFYKNKAPWSIHKFIHKYSDGFIRNFLYYEDDNVELLNEFIETFNKNAVDKLDQGLFIFIILLGTRAHDLLQYIPTTHSVSKLIIDNIHTIVHPSFYPLFNYIDACFSKQYDSYGLLSHTNITPTDKVSKFVYDVIKLIENYEFTKCSIFYGGVRFDINYIEQDTKKLVNCIIYIFNNFDKQHIIDTNADSEYLANVHNVHIQDPYVMYCLYDVVLLSNVKYDIYDRNLASTLCPIYEHNNNNLWYPYKLVGEISHAIHKLNSSDIIISGICPDDIIAHKYFDENDNCKFMFKFDYIGSIIRGYTHDIYNAPDQTPTMSSWIWSLGVVLIELIVNRDELKLQMVLDSHPNEVQTLLNKIYPLIDERQTQKLLYIIETCMQEKPSNRLTTKDLAFGPINVPIKYKLLENTFVFNNKSFIIGNCIGHGSFGVVFEASDINSLNSVAVKISRHKFTDIECNTIKHKHIVRVYTCTQQSISKYYMCIMEYCNRGNLHKYMLKHYPNGLYNHTNIVIDMLKQICDGLRALYDNKIMHRNIKLENILINYENNVLVLKIADLGLSKQYNNILNTFDNVVRFKCTDVT